MSIQKDVLKSYIPRHKRLGLCCAEPVVEGFHSVLESIPIVDDDGRVLRTDSVVRSVPAVEEMSKYRVADFKLSSKIRNGVPLSVVNINHSSSFTIDQLQRICEDVDRKETFIKDVLSERKEKESWFKSFDYPEPINNVVEPSNK